MLLTDEEIKDLFDNLDLPWRNFARAVEAAVLEKLKSQDPKAWRIFDGEGGYDYSSYTDNENYREEFLARNPNPIYKDWVEPLYLHPIPADDIVREVSVVAKLR